MSGPPPNRFVGREDELGELDRLARSARLTSVVGPPGIGKSRLVAQWRAAKADDARIVEFSLLDAHEGIVGALASTLGLSTSALAPADLAARVGYALDARAIEWLVLDEAEGALAGLAETLPEWLALAPRLRIVATSRVLLRLPGEQPLELAPLDRDSAVELLSVRSREVGAKIEDAAALDALAARLDRLPLALELAAARMRSLTPDALLARLETSFAILSSGYRNAPARHRTLRAAFEASYALLDGNAQRAWSCLSLLCEPFDLHAASALFGGDALEAIETLRDASLLSGEPHAMRMLSSVRAYGRERLEETHAYARHFDWAMAADPPPIADLDDAAQRARADGDDERAARALLRVHHALRTCEPANAGAQRLAPLDAAALTPATRARLVLARSDGCSPSEARALAEEALAIAIEIADPELQIDAHQRSSVLAYLRGDDELAYAHAMSALALHPTPARAAAIESSLGVNFHVRGRHDEAREHYEGALALARLAGDRASEARALSRLGFLAVDLGRHDAAETYLRDALSIAASTRDAHVAALARGYLGNVMRYRRRLGDAREQYDAAIAGMRALGDRAWEAVFTMDLGILLLDHQRTGEAHAALRAAHAAARAVENARVEGLIEGYLAAACACAGDAVGFEAHLARARTFAERVAGLAEVTDTHALHAHLDARDEIDRPRHGHAELAARIVRARVAPSRDELAVNADRTRFAIGGTRADLGAYDATCRIFALLVEERIERRGSIVPTPDLIAAGWPGERVRSRAALNRLRVAIRQLRKSGLVALQTVRGGYRLDPDVEVRTWSD